MANDQAARDRIEREFDKNFLVEAGAGSGKTRSLARRMAAGIAAGVYDVERMAAVTFTRKAAAELRGRFQEALEERLRSNPPDDERARIEEALRRIERLFAGTIHAFCAHLLRERPVEARVAPGFVELDEVEDAVERERAWRDYVAARRASGSPSLLALQRAGIRPQHLDDAFGIVCQNEDVEFPPGSAEMPEAEPAWKALERFWTKLEPLIPPKPDPEHKCKVLKIALEFGTRFSYARRWKRQPAVLAGFLDDWNRDKVTQKWWNGGGAEAKALVEAFRTEVVEPFVEAWCRYIYRLAVTVLVEAREAYAAERRRQNVVNYVDLLLVTAQLLRENEPVRLALQQKYRWFFIDEFQDTDPIQAEIFLLLASGSPQPLTPGSLFVVGDPKQSIYRFRRADIDIYNRVRDLIVKSGGEVLHLTANWRSLPGVCELTNTVFPGLFPAEATRESPAFEPLDPKRSIPAHPAATPAERTRSDAIRDDGARPHTGSGEGVAPCIMRLVVPEQVGKGEVPAWEADCIARYIRQQVTDGARQYGSFLVLTRYRRRLEQYADAFDRYEIPVEVSGAGRFGGSEQVVALALLVGALADPFDGPSLVGVLRGPLFGISDAELFAFRAAGGRFELNAPLVGDDGARLADAEREPRPGFSPEAHAALVGYLDATYGPVLPALRTLRSWRKLAQRLPLGAAVERMLEESGWLALAATSPGGAKAGDLLQAIDVVRQVAEGGGGLAEAAEALTEDEETSAELEALPLEPGKRNVVRLMNLHKAKGLEADVVFLADPQHGRTWSTDVRIVREGARPVGYLEVARKWEGAFGSTVLGEPDGWDGHKQVEEAYRKAEVNRLLYVAATRARDLLVVGQWAKVGSRGASQNEAWGAFDEFLAGVPELLVPVAQGTSPAQGTSAAQGAPVEQGFSPAIPPFSSWQVTSVTGEHAPVRTRAARVRDEMAEPEEVMLAAETPLAAETATERVDAGAEWGTLIHGLLEHAMRHAGATRQDLARLALWLTVEHEDLRPSIDAALDVVEAVMKADFWREAQASPEHLVEVPFAITVAPGSTPVAQGFSLAVLRGVIDLVYRADDGWRILDYKTDRVEGGVAELIERHGAQLEAYVGAWRTVTGDTPARSGIFWVRDQQLGWRERGQ